MLRFPKDFVWGSSTSGPQTEGRVAGDGKEIISGIIGTKWSQIVTIMGLVQIKHQPLMKTGKRILSYC